MIEQINHIGYIVSPPRKRGVLHDPKVEQSVAFQEQLIENFIEETPERKLLHTLVEQGDKKRNRSKWPILEEVIQLCTEHNATLVIAELRNLTNNEKFIELLDKSTIKFICCDQPLVTRETLSVVAGHQRNLREIHGRLIKKGLENTTKRSGNPRAKEVIGSVNKPKIENAIMFALLLQPVVAQFKEKGYSQRRMVQELNNMEFNAPEGGKWVLSQLQKVLDRIKLNELALDLELKLLEFKQKQMTPVEIASELNTQGVPPIKRTSWDERQVTKLIDRVKEIHDIIRFNEYVVELMPLITQYRGQGLGDTDIIEKFIEHKLPVPESIVEDAVVA